MNCEWDEHKRQANIIKHGIDFMDVPKLFENDVVILPDERLDYGETRYIVIGLLRHQVVVAA